MVYEYNIQANVAGEVQIPATSISYFDLSSEKYRTTKTDETSLKVIEDKNYIVNSENPPANTQNAETEVLSDLRPSQTMEPKSSFYGTGVFWTAVTSPFLFAFLFIIFAKRKKENASSLEIKKEIKKKDNALSLQLEQLNQLVHSDQDVLFYSTVETALKKAFEIDMELTEDRLINKQEIFSHIDRNYSEEFKTQVSALFNECEQFRYGFGASTNGKEEGLSQLNTIIQHLNG